MSAADGQTLAVVELSKAILHRQHMHKIDDHAAVDVHKCRIIQFFCHRAEARALEMRALRCEEADILPLARDVKDLAQRQLFQAVRSLDRVAFAVLQGDKLRRIENGLGQTFFQLVLRHIAKDVQRVGVDRVLTVARDEDHPHLRQERRDTLDQRHAVQPRHFDIEEDQVIDAPVLTDIRQEALTFRINLHRHRIAATR